MQTRTLSQIIDLAQQKRSQGQKRPLSWSLTAEECGILTADGRPDPGMIYRMVKERYDPKTPSTRLRLGLPPICPTCYQKIPRPPRVIPEWLKQAVDNLATLERATPDPVRLYARGGKRVQNS